MQFGRYQVVRMIGQGGMATVYEACEPRLNRRVAIKVMHAALAASPELLARFEVEARIVNGIYHPGIVAVYDLARLRDGAVYLVMEFIEGETLAHRLARQVSRRLDLAEIYRLTRQIADTLGTVHFHGIVHRDVKPDNLMLVTDSFVAGGVRIKLIDFGLAKIVNDNPKPSGLDTRVGVGLGTVDYIAPEQILDARNSNDRADVYSLGCIVFELAAGRKPFIGDNNLQILGSHLTRPAPDVQEFSPELPRQLASLVASMLAKEPQQRPSMRQVVRNLDLIWRTWVNQGADTIISRSHCGPLAPPPSPSRGLFGSVAAPLRWRQTLGLLAVGTTVACLPLVLLLQTCRPRSLPAAARPFGGDQAPDSGSQAAPVPSDHVPFRRPAEPAVARHPTAAPSGGFTKNRLASWSRPSSQ